MMVKYEKGQPCKHPGCASHLSIPCQSCGRYAAGLLDGPDLDACWLRMDEYYQTDPLFYKIAYISMERGWTDEQMLFAFIFALKMQLDQLTTHFLSYIENSASLGNLTLDQIEYLIGVEKNAVNN